MDGYRPIMEEFHYFHDYTRMIILFILTFVGFILSRIFFNKVIYKGLLQGQLIESVWTAIPGLILIQIALPSLSLLYMIEDSPSPRLTIKAIGHQWYWEYEYRDFWVSDSDPLAFDAYMIPERDLPENGFRQFETDNRLVLPIITKVRVLVSRADVIHAWTIPRLGVKADAIPGRINQLNFTSSLPGLLFGQCSEICGRQHSRIPIALELVRLKYFYKWLILSMEE